MLGAAHYEYQFYSQQPGEAGSQIVAVSLKPLDFRAKDTTENIHRKTKIFR